MDAKEQLWNLAVANRAWFEDQLEWSGDDAGDEWALLTGVLDLITTPARNS